METMAMYLHKPTPPGPSNRLIQEKSPYLLQHAHNPVDWFPWGEEAFGKAKRENKPLFLSIGYSTCHWCHVMERECFENADIARLLNELFVCVKVDREERPDVDKIYMDAVIVMTGQGGWPLNVFLTPDLRPFYGGTYFPPDERYGRPGFPAVLNDVARVWREKPEEAEKAGRQLAGMISPTVLKAPDQPLGEKAINDAIQAFTRIFDPKEGGFGSAPKFPQSMILGLLQRAWLGGKDPSLLSTVELTLDKMSQGGIYDQVGGGFARYSTDEQWLVPHFEKMLYDNALLARAYLEGFQATGKGEYARIARDIFDYLFRDMADPSGGFYSAEDADSEGVEGKFYIWKPAELRKILGEKDGEAFCSLYGVTAAGNFEGHNILHLNADLPSALKNLGKDEAWWRGAREKVLQARSKRIRPHRDDKILLSWNSLLISSLAYAYQVLGDKAYLEAAEKACGFLAKNLVRNGRLLVSYRGGPAAVEGFLDDYAFFQAAQLDLFESTFKKPYLEEALRLRNEMKRLFWDEKEGGFFFTGSDQKDAHRLLTRLKEAHDGAIPSGNSLAALTFYRLAEFTSRKDIRDDADAVIKCFSGHLAKSSHIYPQMLQALQFAASSPAEILVAGDRAQDLLQAVWKAFLPHKVLVSCGENQARELAPLVPWVENRPSQGGKATAYVCRNYQCQLPTSDPHKMLELLGQK